MPIMFSLNPDAAVIDLVRFVDIGSRTLSLAPSILQYLATNDAEIAKQKVRGILRDSSDQLSLQMLIALFSTQAITHQLARFIAAECPDNIFNSCLGWASNSAIWSSEYISDLVNFKKNWTQQSMSMLLNGSIVPLSDKLNAIEKSMGTFDQATLNLLTALLPNIIVSTALHSPDARLDMQRLLSTLPNLNQYLLVLSASNAVLLSVFSK